MWGGGDGHCSPDLSLLAVLVQDDTGTPVAQTHVRVPVVGHPGLYFYIHVYIHIHIHIDTTGLAIYHLHLITHGCNLFL